MTGPQLFAYDARTRPSIMTADGLEKLLAPVQPPHFAASGEHLRAAFVRDPRRRILVVLEAVNAGGKDGTIEELRDVLGDHTFRVERIKRPIHHLLGHDLLAVAAGLVPAPGELVVFNRSYYEAPVHSATHARADFVDLCERTVAFEDRLASHGICLVKIFIHIDKDEQLRRLEGRIRHRHLHHLHNPFDFRDQTHWAALMRAYDSVLSLTHTPTSPWLMIPGNDRSFRNHGTQVVLARALGAR